MTITISAVSVNQIPLDFTGNVRRITDGIQAAKSAGASLVCFSELCVPGYGCEDWFLSEGLRARALQSLQSLLPHAHGILVVVGVPIESEGKIYNSAAVLWNGEIAGFYCKQNLANEGVYYEHRWFTPSAPGKFATISILGKAVPVGDLVFSVGDATVGFELCEDAWVPHRPATRCLERGVNVLINLSGSHFSFGKLAKRKQLVLDGSTIINGAYVYCNALGNESGRLIFDGGNLFASSGTLIRQGKRFVFNEIHVDTATLPLLVKSGAKVSDSGRVALPGSLAGSRPASLPQMPADDWESSTNIECEEFSRAAALGLGDYRRKTGASGYVISLSGGIDSAATAVLVYYLQKFAAGCSNPSFWLGTGKLLSCVYQTAAQSSLHTFEAAKLVAQGTDATFHTFDVSGLVDSYTTMVEHSIGRKLEWSRDDISLQNIQARTRSPGVWLLANSLGAILLTTSNRSEASVGYCTMDGDTSGGLCPLGGVSKDFLRSWLTWAKDYGCVEIGELPFLDQVLHMPPTAELRPGGQTDESDLMPYRNLQHIERQMVFEKKLPSEITGEDRRQIDRFFSLWSASQWKRERLAPSFHLDEYSVDPKTWCRFPILSKLTFSP